MLGRAGLYRQQNIEKRKVMSVREWSELCAKDDLRAPGVDDVELKAAADSVGERRRRRRKRSVAKDTVQVVKEDMNTRNWSVLRHLLISMPKT